MSSCCQIHLPGKIDQSGHVPRHHLVAATSSRKVCYTRTRQINTEAAMTAEAPAAAENDRAIQWVKKFAVLRMESSDMYAQTKASALGIASVFIHAASFPDVLPHNGGIVATTRP